MEELQAATHTAWREIRKRAASALAGQRGTLLAVAADESDAVRAFGGTLARYADAGVEIWLACLGSGTATGGLGPFALAGTVALDAANPVGDLARIMSERSPHVTVAPGRTHDEQEDLCKLARHAWDQAETPGRLFCTAHTHPGTATHARLDVRPWQDVRSAVLNTLNADDRTAASEAPERETFAAAVPTKHVIVDLFQPVD